MLAGNSKMILTRVFLACLLIPVSGNANVVEWLLKTVAKIIPEPRPDDLSVIQPTVHLFTRSNMTTNAKFCSVYEHEPVSVKILENNLTMVHSFGEKMFSEYDEFVVITHGWTGKLCGRGAKNWRAPLVNNLLNSRPNIKVVFVNWKEGARPTFLSPYANPVANVPVIGKAIAEFLVRVAGYAGVRLNSTKIHCVGFSLGSHVCSYLCRRLGEVSPDRTLCGRLTALDPAGVRYDGKVPGTRVSSRDADFVDAYHSSKIGLGFSIGHVDVFINDFKKGAQDGCRRTLGSFGKCSHTVAPKFFAQSISEPESACFIDEEHCLCSKYEGFPSCPRDCSLRLGYFTLRSSRVGRVDIERDRNCWND